MHDNSVYNRVILMAEVGLLHGHWSLFTTMSCLWSLRWVKEAG